MSQTIIFDEAAYAAGTKRRIIENARKTFYKNVPDAGDLVQFIYEQAARAPNEFMSSLDNALNNYGKLTEKQCEAVRASMARLAAKKAEWAAQKEEADSKLEYVGEVGAKKFPLRITVKKIVRFQGKSFSYYDSGMSTMYICEDESGNKISYFGSAEMPAEGETGDILCTIKKHEVYKGSKQTVITRPKMVESK